MCSILSTCTLCVNQTGCYWITPIFGNSAQFCQFGTNGSAHYHELSFGYQAPLICPKPPPTPPPVHNASFTDFTANGFYMFLGIFIFAIGLSCLLGCGFVLAVLECIRRRSRATMDGFRNRRFLGRNGPRSSVVSLFRPNAGVNLEAANSVHNSDEDEDIIQFNRVQQTGNEEEQAEEPELRRSNRTRRPVIPFVAQM